MDSIDTDPVELDSLRRSEQERQNPPSHGFNRPVSEWPFEPQTELAVRRILATYTFEVIEVDEEELFCSCMGVDDGTPMIMCSNEEKCLRQWYHLRCIDLETLLDEDGKYVSSYQAQRLITAEDWYCDRCIQRNIEKDNDVLPCPKTKTTYFHLSSRQAPARSLTARLEVSAKKAGTLLPLKLTTSLTNPKFLGVPGKESWSAPLFRKSNPVITPTTPDPRSTVSDSFPVVKKTRTQPQTTFVSKSEWSFTECEAMKKFMRQLVAAGTHKTEQKWVLASQYMKNLGMLRSENSCKMVWMRKLRAETGIDERIQGRRESLTTGTWTKKRKKALDEEKAALAKRAKLTHNEKEGVDVGVGEEMVHEANKTKRKSGNKKGRNGGKD